VPCVSPSNTTDAVRPCAPGGTRPHSLVESVETVGRRTVETHARETNAAHAIVAGKLLKEIVTARSECNAGVRVELSSYEWILTVPDDASTAASVAARPARVWRLHHDEWVFGELKPVLSTSSTSTVRQDRNSSLYTRGNIGGTVAIKIGSYESLDGAGGRKPYTRQERPARSALEDR